MDRIARRLALGMLGALGLAGLTASAMAADELLLPGDRLRTSLPGDGESRIATAGIAGSEVTLTVKRVGKQGIEPILRVIDPAGRTLDLTGRLKLSPRKAIAKKVPFEATGIYRVGVSALSGGGEYELSMKVKARKKVKLAGELLDEADVFETTLQAVPGTRISVVLKSKGKPRFTPRLEVIAPDGSPLIAIGKAPKPGGVLPDLGEYTLRVSGGPGRFRGVVKVQPPDVRARDLTYADVEAAPQLAGVRPATLDNDEVGNLFVDGFGFGGGDIVTLSDGERGLAQGGIERLTDTGIATDLDLTGIAPGSYTISVVTSIGTEVVAESPLVVTNRPPNVQLLGTPATGEGRVAPLTLMGRGFDPDCTVQVRRRGDGLDIPLQVTARDGPTSLSVDLTVPRYAVGEYDVTTSDPSGTSRTHGEPLQIVGFSGAESVLATDPDFGNLYPQSVAFDPVGNRLLVAGYEGGRPFFRLVDTTTNQVVSTFLAATGVSGFPNPHVAWDAVNGAWAMTWVDDLREDEAWVRVAAADDLNDVLSHTRVGLDDTITLCTVAANAQDGGFAVVWDQRESGGAAQLLALVLDPGAEPDPVDAVLVREERDIPIIFDPNVFDRGDGFFVVVYTGIDPIGSALSLRRTVLRADATVLIASEVLASSRDWFALGNYHLAFSPLDGSALLSFSSLDDDIEFHTSVLPLSGALVRPTGSSIPLDEFGRLPESFADSLIWSAERGAFLVTVTKLGLGITVREVSTDGVLRLYNAGEEQEGSSGVLFSDATGGRVGMVRAADGLDDLITDVTGEVELRVGSFR